MLAATAPRGMILEARDGSGNISASLRATQIISSALSMSKNALASFDT
jgi:hypothetical protein